MSNAAATIDPNASENKGAQTPAGTSTARERQFQKAVDAHKKRIGVTMEDVFGLLPTVPQMDNIHRRYAVEIADEDEAIGAGLSAVRDMHAIFKDVLVYEDRGEVKDTALRIQLDRMVEAAVKAAWGSAGNYESARLVGVDMADSFKNEHRDEDRPGIDGTANRIERQREKTASLAARAFSVALYAKGMVEGYKEVMGKDWQPYVPAHRGPSIDEQAAASRAEAIGF